MKFAGASDEVIAKACDQQPQEGQAAQGQNAPPKPPHWKTPPTPLGVIKADPPTYLDNPTLVHVALKPSAYFNYGYSEARNSHFSFEMQALDDNGDLDDNGESMHGYALRAWARPFFEAVNKKIKEGHGEFAYVTATLYVSYQTARYKGDSADEIEIIAAALGADYNLAPPPSAPAAVLADKPKGKPTRIAVNPNDVYDLRNDAAAGDMAARMTLLCEFHLHHDKYDFGSKELNDLMGDAKTVAQAKQFCGRLGKK